MADEDSTDLSVTGEEGNSTILLAHYIFLFFIQDKVIKQCWFLRKIAHKKIGIRPKNVFVFSSNFEQLSLQKVTFDWFLSNFWATFWEITGNFLENLEQLVESPCPGLQVGLLN